MNISWIVKESIVHL